ncbi:MAG: hypothetical protein Kow0032_03660 [Methyloligellaceae bacterium]
MRNSTKILAVAGTLLLAGGLGAATFAFADHHGGGWQRGSHSGHHMGHHMGRHMGHHMGHHMGGHMGHKFARLMERFDSDGDGKLTQEELNKSRTQLLEKFDSDKDGELSLAEFEKLWLDVMRRRMVRSFQRLDEDGNAQVTLDEFLKPYGDIVERLDRNDDGVLDKEDRRAGPGMGHEGGQRGGPMRELPGGRGSGHMGREG